MNTIQNTQTSSAATSFDPTTGKGRSAVCLSPVELVSLAESGMQGYDAMMSEKMSAQRRDVHALKRLNAIKAKLAAFKDGLNKDDDKDRGKGRNDEKKYGRHLRGQAYRELQTELSSAMKELPPEYADAARVCLKTMHEKKDAEFDADQAAKMTETIEAEISDIETRQQMAMAEINNLMSQRSNMLEMTKNISTSLMGQQDFITRNAPR